MSSRALSWLALLCLAPAAAAVAAPTPILAVADSTDAAAPLLGGRVVDARTGEPIADVNIRARGAGGDADTGPDGRFTLPLPSRGPVTLVVTRAGYALRTLRLDSERADAAAPLTIALQPAVYAGEAIVITASRYGDDVHLSQSSVPRDDIDQRATEQDLPVLLEDLPGVYASSDAGNGVGYTYLNIRGFSQQRVGVMINGIPLNDPEDQQVYWVDMPGLAESLEDIQVQRGITNSLGGMTAIGGTVNLVTEVLGPRPQGRLTLRAGSFGTAQQSASYQTGLLGGRFAAALRVSHLASDGFRQRSGSDQWAAFWSGRYTAPGHQVQANVYTGREVSHQAWDGIDARQLAADRTANPYVYPNAVDDFRQPHYELHWRWDVTDRVTLDNSAFVIHGEGFYENFKGGATARDYGLDRFLGLGADDTLGVVRRKWVRKDQVGWVPQLTVAHAGGRLVAGGDWYTFHSSHWGEVIAAGGYPQSPPLKYADYSGDKIAWSAYLNEQWEAARGLTLLLDLQYQRKTYDFAQHATGDFQGDLLNAYSVAWEFFNPKGGVFWRLPAQPLGGEAALYAHVGVAHREPADADLFDTWTDAYDLGARPLFAAWRDVPAGDGTTAYREWSGPLVRPERVVNWETGAAWRGPALSVTLNGYWMDFRDEIVPYGGVREDGASIKGNADRTLHRGLEAGLTWRPRPGHTLTAAASRSWNTIERFVSTDDGTDYAGRPIALFPDRMVTLTWRAQGRRLDGSVRLRAVGRQYLDNSGLRDRTLEPYTTLDLSLGASLATTGANRTGSARAELRVRNLLDAKYATSGYYDGYGAGNYYLPAAGRNFLAEVRYDF